MKKRKKKKGQKEEPEIVLDNEDEDDEGEEEPQGEPQGEPQDDGDEDVTDEEEALVRDLVAGVVKDELKPVIQSVRTLTKRFKAADPRMIGKLGPPNMDPSDDDGFNIDWKPKGSNFDGVPKNEFCFGRAIQALVAKDWSMAPFEKELSDHVCKTLTWASGSGGGLWVPEEFLSNEFIDMLRANQVVREAGATVLSNLTGSPVRIPKATGSATVGWVGQDATQTASDSTPAQLTMVPHICMGRSKISEQMVLLNPGAVEPYVREDLASGIGLAFDLAMLRGTGTNEQPLGMANLTSKLTVAMGTNGGTVTIDKCYDMLYQLELNNVKTDKLNWFCHPLLRNTLRKLKDTNGRYYFQPDPSSPQKGTLLGYPVSVTTQIPINLTKGSGTALTELYLTAMPYVIIGEWGALNVKATDVGGDAWANNLIEVKATYYVDVGFRHDQAVCLMNDCQ